MATLTNAFGFGAVVLFFGIVTWIGFVFLLRTARHVNFILAGLALLGGLAAGFPIWGPRTQMITFTFSVVLLYILRRYREDGQRRWLYWIPPLFLLWVNLHAGFTIGLIFLGTYIVGQSLELARDSDRRLLGTRLVPLLVVAAIATLVVAVNPNLAGIYVYAARTQFSAAQQRLIVEWQSPNFHDFIQFGPFEVMLLLTLILLAVSKRRPRATDLLLLVLGTVLALQSVRHIALFVAVTVPIAADLLHGTWERLREAGVRFTEPRPTPGRGVINTFVLLIVAIPMLLLEIPAFGSNPRSSAIMHDYPVKALDSVQNDLPPGHVFNQYGWGGYFVYRIWPSQSVFIYGDAAIMGDSFLNEYEGVAHLGPDYLRTLEMRRVTWVLDATDGPLVNVLRNSSGWALIYKDKVASLLVRRSDETAAYLERHSR